MRKPKQISGQGLIEFALVLPILLFLVIGTLDLGSAFFVKVKLENSAREGAYYMVYHTADDKSPFLLTKAAVQNEGKNAGIQILPTDITVTCLNKAGTSGTTCLSGSGYTVDVTVQHNMALAIDIFGNGPLTLTSHARMLIP